MFSGTFWVGVGTQQLQTQGFARDFAQTGFMHIEYGCGFSLGFISPLPGPETRSTSRPFCVALGRPPCLGAI